jgi:hypothetical protein
VILAWVADPCGGEFSSFSSFSSVRSTLCLYWHTKHITCRSPPLPTEFFAQGPPPKHHNRLSTTAPLPPPPKSTPLHHFSDTSDFNKVRPKIIRLPVRFSYNLLCPTFTLSLPLYSISRNQEAYTDRGLLAQQHPACLHRTLGTDVVVFNHNNPKWLSNRPRPSSSCLSVMVVPERYKTLDRIPAARQWPLISPWPSPNRAAAFPGTLTMMRLRNIST